MSKKQGKRAAGARAGLRGPKVATKKATKGAAGRRGGDLTRRGDNQTGRQSDGETGTGTRKAEAGGVGRTDSLRSPAGSLRSSVSLRSAANTTEKGPEVTFENGQWERFCLLMAQGVYSNKSCYAQVYPGSSEAAARSSSAELLTNPNIRARIEWLKKKAVDEFVSDKAELVRWLHHAVYTPVGFIDEESPLAQEVKWEEVQAGGARGQLRRGDEESGNEESEPVTIVKREVKAVGKKECAALLMKIQGWEKPKEVTLTMAYEPPSKALERAQEKGVDVMGILKKAGILGSG